MQMHPSTPAPPPVVYDNRPPPPMPSPGPAMQQQQQFADVKQPQPMVSHVMQGQQQYPPVPVGSPPPPFQQQPPQQHVQMPMQQPMVASPVQQQPIPAAATMPVVYSQGHGPQLSPWSSHVFDCFDSADECESLAHKQEGKQYRGSSSQRCTDGLTDTCIQCSWHVFAPASSSVRHGRGFGIRAWPHTIPSIQM